MKKLILIYSLLLAACSSPPKYKKVDCVGVIYLKPTMMKQSIHFKKYDEKYNRYHANNNVISGWVKPESFDKFTCYK
ncbi:hypothetical protein AFL46_11560 [Providencia stuartii]|nr:hypothetical protein AFL46_11560 [Providencia stuartii]SPY68259.1 Uncharacterised protein [Providencia stuartii]SPY68494.1 Uncharacterised protein [Providencia stuartii]SPY68637.1 Uncharacterised protein [Providencia stuartii]